MLELKDICWSVGGLEVINKVSLQFKSKELRCIIGPNGAGKTTLFNLITGAIKPSMGSIFFESKDITNLRPHEISRKGIVRKFQVPTIFDDLTVLENMAIASQDNSKVKGLIFSNLMNGSRDQINQILDLIHLSGRERELGGNLSHGEKQWLELGMVFARKPKVMLLDEPTAGMSPHETMQTAKIIRNISGGVTTIVIEHDIKFLKDIGEHVTVLHLGSILTEGTFEEISKNPMVRNVYLGKRV